MYFLTVAPEMLHHLPHHQGHTVLHQALLFQNQQWNSKQLDLLCCHGPGFQYWYLHHLLHVLFDLHRCLAVLHREEQRAAAVSHRLHSCRDWHQVFLSRPSVSWTWCWAGSAMNTVNTVYWVHVYRELGGRGSAGLAVHVLLRQMSGYHATRLEHCQSDKDTWTKKANRLYRPALTVPLPVLLNQQYQTEADTDKSELQSPCAFTSQHRTFLLSDKPVPRAQQKTHKPEAELGHCGSLGLPVHDSHSEQASLLWPWQQLHHVTSCHSRVHHCKRVNWPEREALTRTGGNWWM